MIIIGQLWETRVIMTATPSGSVSLMHMASSAGTPTLSPTTPQRMPYWVGPVAQWTGHPLNITLYLPRNHRRGAARSHLLLRLTRGACVAPEAGDWLGLAKPKGTHGLFCLLFLSPKAPCRQGITPSVWIQDLVAPSRSLGESRCNNGVQVHGTTPPVLPLG